jgi:phosphate:Na+ symporter
MIGTLVGGVGVFLVGMFLLSDGLKAAAGGALRAVLQRFARTPGRAIVSGAGFTALVQSSSATTLTTIGFVSAGLLTFPQAVGLIFGANLGTTSTGWLVSVLGFRVNLGAVALPVVGAGALLRILGRGRWSHGGTALAGFGLIFVGIDILQDGMGVLAERIDPSTFPGASLGGRFILVLAGAVMTVVMQSSSAAVATTLTALHAGGIGVDQAALLVIGQNLGTSVKAVLAAIGGSIPVRRTAVAHTLFNLITAALALALFPLLMGGATLLAGPEDPAVAIAIFHTGFNLLGVLVLAPLLGRFSRLVESLVPESVPSLVRNLDPAVAEVPEVAVEAARRSASEVHRILSLDLVRLLREAGAPRGTPAEPRVPAGRVAELPLALPAIRTFLARVRTRADDPDAFARHLSLIHAVDHLDRMEELRREFPELGALPPELAPQARELATALVTGSRIDEDSPAGAAPGDTAGVDPGERQAAVRALAETSRRLADGRRARRAEILEEIARGEIPPDEGRLRILHLKRMDRIGYHGWRAGHHLDRARPGSPPDHPAEGPPNPAGTATESGAVAAAGAARGETSPSGSQEFRTTEA